MKYPPAWMLLAVLFFVGVIYALSIIEKVALARAAQDAGACACKCGGGK